MAKMPVLQPAHRQAGRHISPCVCMRQPPPWCRGQPSGDSPPGECLVRLLTDACSKTCVCKISRLCLASHSPWHMPGTLTPHVCTGLWSGRALGQCCTRASSVLSGGGATCLHPNVFLPLYVYQQLTGRASYHSTMQLYGSEKMRIAKE